MKILLLSLLALSCTQKYAGYDLIRKVDFDRASYERPIPATQVLANGRDELQECFNQWLFFSNAEKQKNAEIPSMVRMLCPTKDYLMNAEFTDTWWTTLFFTRSCIEIKTMCGDVRNSQ